MTDGYSDDAAFITLSALVTLVGKLIESSATSFQYGSQAVNVTIARM
jgi:hypothetical protein